MNNDIEKIIKKIALRDVEIAILTAIEKGTDINEETVLKILREVELSY